MSAPRYTVFLSHASHDVGVARLIERVLKSLGVACWIDAKDLDAGVHFRDEIVARLRMSNELLVLASPRFASSRWLDYEAGIAAGAQVKTVPMLYDCVPARISDFDMLRHLHAVHIDDFDEYERQLLERVRVFQRAKPQQMQAAMGGTGVPPPPPVRLSKGFYGRVRHVTDEPGGLGGDGVRKLQERIRRELKPKGDNHDD